MESYIKIERVIEKDGREVITYKSDGFTSFEIIGLLTYYRDKVKIGQIQKCEPTKK